MGMGAKLGEGISAILARGTGVKLGEGTVWSS